MLPSGTRVRLLHMPNDPNPIKPGTCGTVVKCHDTSFVRKGEYQVTMKWDDGRTLSMICPPDEYEVI